MSLKTVNTQYLFYLSKYPLLTKSITAGVLAGLNELIASTISGDLKETRFGRVKVKHAFSPKLISMVIYGSLILTPISHNLYGVLNKVFKGPHLSKLLKLLQMLTSLSTITPTLSAIFTSWLSIINNYTIPKNFESTAIPTEFKILCSIVQSGLKNNYFSILRSSILTSMFTLTFAQNYVEPELWVVFFNFVYFILGTFQNTRLKLKQRLLQKKETSE